MVCALVVLVLVAHQVQLARLDLVGHAPMLERFLAAMGDPHFARGDIADGAGQLVPVGVVGDDQRQLDHPLAGALADAHPAARHRGDRIGQAAAPAVVQGRRRAHHESAAQLLLTAGDNSERLRSEASFAALCGVSPVPASSGRTTRHRLNRGGDRAANSALHIIAIGRLRTDPRTKAYIEKRMAEGHSKLEAIRCLKRYIAREVYALISQRRREINQAQVAA